MAWILQKINYIIRKFFKVILLIAAGSLLISLVATLVAGQVLTPYIPLIAPKPVAAGYIGYYAGLFCFFIVPLLLLGKWMINFTFGYRSTHQFRKTIGGFWMVSFVAFVGTAAFTARNFTSTSSISETIITADIDTSKVLEIKLNKLNLDNEWARIMVGPARLSDGNLYANDIAVRALFSPADSSQVTIGRSISSHGVNRRQARQNTSYASHSINLTNNVLDLDRYYVIERGGKFRVQEIDYNVELPVGTKVKFAASSRRAYRKMFGNRDYSTHELYIMTNKGLVKEKRETTAE